MESELVWRIIVAAFLGAFLGLERSLAGKHAGMRTYALVSMGSALFTGTGMLVTYQFQMLPSISPLQLAGFVIVGIGFIGSGLAMTQTQNHVELTTAAGIWLVAGIGIAAGFGFYGLAIASTVLGVLTFSLFARVERSIRVRFGERYTGRE